MGGRPHVASVRAPATSSRRDDEEEQMRSAREAAAARLEAFNAHDEQGIRALYADDVVLEAPADVRCEGADASLEYAMSWLRAFPDGRLTPETAVADGEWVAQRMILEGTHGDAFVGPEGSIPATHRRVRIEAVEFIRVEGGLIVEDHLCFDQAQVLAQLGLMPELASRA